MLADSNSNDGSYQAHLPVPGLESDDSDVGDNEALGLFFDELVKLNVIELTVGFANDSDECDMRHLSAVIRMPDRTVSHVSQHCTDWPAALTDIIDKVDMWELLEQYDVEYLTVFKVGRRKIEQGSALYITQPKLVDEYGDEVDWNYWR